MLGLNLGWLATIAVFTVTSVIPTFESVYADDIGESFQCPPGYYFDDQLQYCTQDNQNFCSNGTYYEPHNNQCVQFPAPPPTVSCPGYTHFDPFLLQCVQDQWPRCPFNYSWDISYNRCTRLPYTCSLGQAYDWNLRECINVWPATCSPGSYFDYYRNTCSFGGFSCRLGFFWDPIRLECRFNSRGYNPGYGGGGHGGYIPPRPSPVYPQPRPPIYQPPAPPYYPGNPGGGYHRPGPGYPPPGNGGGYHRPGPGYPPPGNGGGGWHRPPGGR